MKENNHLTVEELENFSNSSNKLILLEHIRLCPLCSERLMEQLSKQSLLPAPHYLKQTILTKIKRQKQKQQEFYAYCIKVGFAVAASLAIILFSNITTDFISMEKQTNTTPIHQELSTNPKENISYKIYQGTDKINQTIIAFTNNLFHIT